MLLPGHIYEVSVTVLRVLFVTAPQMSHLQNASFNVETRTALKTSGRSICAIGYYFLKNVLIFPQDSSSVPTSHLTE